MKYLSLLLVSMLFVSVKISDASEEEKGVAWDSTVRKDWPKPFEVIEIKSTADGATQRAYGYQSKKTGMPLVVSLHTWSGDYAQKDPLAKKIVKAGFNFIHPDFRGPNKTPDSCGSRLVIQDIDDAISYCIDRWNVDERRIYVVGTSGGGHATCVAYFRSEHSIAAFFAWVPITDIHAWYLQTKHREYKYWKDIENICGGAFDLEDANSRSPMKMKISKRNAPLYLYAGIKDGYHGSVPISHSINLYNKLADVGERVDDSTIVKLITRQVETPVGHIGDRKVWLQSQSARSSLTIFEGGHEMLVDYAAKEIVEYANEY